MEVIVGIAQTILRNPLIEVFSYGKSVSKIRFLSKAETAKKAEIVEGAIDDLIVNGDKILVVIDNKKYAIVKVDLDCPPVETLNAKARKEGRYRAFNEAGVSYAKTSPTTIEALGGEKGLRKLISVDLSPRVNDPLWSVKVRAIRQQRPIFVVRKGDVYVTVSATEALKLYTNCKGIQLPLRAPEGQTWETSGVRLFVPTFHTASGRNAGIFKFVEMGARNAYERELSGITSDEIIASCRNSYGKIIKSMKRMDMSAGAKSTIDSSVIDWSEVGMAVAQIKNMDDGYPFLGDGNFVAKVESIADMQAWQVRLQDFTKGLMKNCSYDFDFYWGMIRENHIPYEIIGNSNNIRVISDLNSTKMMPYRLDGKSSLIKQVVVGESVTHAKELAKMRLLGINTTPFYDLMLDQAMERIERCLTPQPRSGFVPSMVRGLDRTATIRAIRKVVEDIENNDNFGVVLGGPILTATMSRRFNDREVVSEFYGHKAINLWVNPKDCVRKGYYRIQRFPSTSLGEIDYIRILHDNTVCRGCFCCGINATTVDLFVRLGGMDCDGDTVHTIPLTDEYGMLTHLGSEMIRLHIEGETIAHEMPTPVPARIENMSDYVGYCAIAGSNQTGILLGSANTLCYSDKDVVSKVLFSGEQTYAERFAGAKSISQSDCVLWAESLRLCKAPATSDEWMRFYRDTLRVGSWCAEAATAIAGTGAPVCEELVNFFAKSSGSIKAAIRDKDAAEKAKAASEGRTLPHTTGDSELDRVVAELGSYANEIVKDFVFVSDSIRNESNRVINSNGVTKVLFESLKKEFGVLRYASACTAEKDAVNVYDYVNGMICNMGFTEKTIYRAFAWALGMGTMVCADEYLTELGYTNAQNAVQASNPNLAYAICELWDDGKSPDGAICASEFKYLYDDASQVSVRIVNRKHKLYIDGTGCQNNMQIWHSAISRIAEGAYVIDRIIPLSKTNDAPKSQVVFLLSKKI